MTCLDTWRTYYPNTYMRGLYTAFGIEEEEEVVVEEVDDIVPVVPVIADRVEVPDVIEVQEIGMMPTTKVKISFGKKKDESKVSIPVTDEALPTEPAETKLVKKDLTVDEPVQSAGVPSTNTTITEAAAQSPKPALPVPEPGMTKKRRSAADFM